MVIKEKIYLTVDETYVISQKKGNGLLVRRIWTNLNGNVIKYSLAYINFEIYAGDGGRVLGYDNSHGYDHKHYFGDVIPVKFETFSQLEAQFEKEFEEISHEFKQKIKSLYPQTI